MSFHHLLLQPPALPSVAAAQSEVEGAMDRVRTAEANVASAAKACGHAICQAIGQSQQINDSQQAHRGGQGIGELVASTYRAMPTHLATAFTKDFIHGLELNQQDVWQDWAAPQQPVALTREGEQGFLLRWGPQQKDKTALFSALPLVGGARPWVIIADDASDGVARGLMQALVLRIACMLPQQSRFTFLDPLQYGQTFPMQRYLPAVRDVGVDMAQDLQKIQADVRRIIRDVVAFHGSFDALPAEQQAAERYEFIFAADFPRAKAYDRRVTEMLFDIGRAGPKAGRYLILHITSPAELPHGIAFDQLGEAYRIDLTAGADLRVDTPPPPQLQQLLLERIRGAVPARRSVDFYDILPKLTERWAGTASRKIEASLDGQKDGLRVLFGQREDGSELVHAVLAASAGAGKSNLLHALILGLASTYPPEELHLYLMDLKQGVEFQPYAELPHSAVVAYNTAPALARAVLSELRREMTRRYEELFRPAGVQKLEDYRNAGEKHGPAPRILLVIDEYQALFQGIDPQEVSADLLALSTQGRAAGIHMLLGSQTFRAVGMQGSEQIFNNINTRIAMRIPAAAVQTLSEFDREGKDLIRELDGTGQVVINSGAGRDGANKRGQVVFVPPDLRTKVLADMKSIGARWPADKRARWPRTQVFDGSRAPALSTHPLTEAARLAGGALSAQAVAAWAGVARSANGLGRSDWRSNDGPIPLVLGREFAVHGTAACILRRLTNQNLLVLGGSAAARIAMLRAIGASINALAADVVGAVRIIDFSGDPAITSAMAKCERGVRLDPQAAVDAIGAAVDGSEILMLIEPDRSAALMRPSDPMTRAAGPEALERRLREGPLKGSHTILAVNSLASLTRVLGRRGASAFAWRAVTQMSQEDSQDLLGNRLAAQLRGEGATGPEPALLADTEGNRNVRFIPYGE